LPRRVVEDWCAQQGARVVLYDENRGGNVHSFCLVKESWAAAPGDSDVASVAEPMMAAKRGAA
jgi:hypothetical protein